jgi:hypothetical protein
MLHKLNDDAIFLRILLQYNCEEKDLGLWSRLPKGNIKCEAVYYRIQSYRNRWIFTHQQVYSDELHCEGQDQKNHVDRSNNGNAVVVVFNEGKEGRQEKNH